MNIIIDTSVYISNFLQKDIFYKKTKSFLRKIASLDNISIYIPIIIAIEISTILKRKKIVNLKKRTDFLSKFNIIKYDKQFFTEFTDFLSKKSLTLKTSDLSICFSAYRHNSILISWDRQLLRESSLVCSSMTPDQFIDIY